MHEKKNRLFSFKLVIIITTTIFSFSSMTTAFYLMGSQSLPVLLFSAIFYFIPFTLIVTDFSSVYGHCSGNIYLWIKNHLNPRVAFITIFLWYCSYFIWMISLFMKLWIPASITFFGKDLTLSSCSFLPIKTTYVISILSILAVFFTYRLVQRGFKTIVGLLTISGIFMLILIAASCILNSLIWLKAPQMISTNFHQSLSQGTFVKQSTSMWGAFFPFIIFAITAFGGLDTIASFSDKLQLKSKKSLSILIFSSLAIIIAYLFCIILWSGAIDLGSFASQSQLHLGNLMYELMRQQGLTFAQVFHLSATQTFWLTQLLVRFTAMTILCSYLGLLASIIYLPLRTLLEGIPETYLPIRWTTKNTHGIASTALKIQCIFITLCIILITLDFGYVHLLYNQLTIMTNISRSLPYLIVAGAYPLFNHAHQIKTTKKAWIISTCVIISITLAILMQLYEKIQAGEISHAVSLIGGPILFAWIANRIYQRKDRLSIKES